MSKLVLLIKQSIYEHRRILLRDIAVIRRIREIQLRYLPLFFSRCTSWGSWFHSRYYCQRQHHWEFCRFFAIDVLAEQPFPHRSFTWTERCFHSAIIRILRRVRQRQSLSAKRFQQGRPSMISRVCLIFLRQKIPILSVISQFRHCLDIVISLGSSLLQSFLSVAFVSIPP